MIGLRRYMQEGNGTPEVNMAPLIDMVFILLIFFLVTTSFVSESGIDADRPRAETAKHLPPDHIQVGIAADGQIYIDGQTVTLLSLRAALREKMLRKPKPVLIVSDTNAKNGVLVDVMDECTIAGASKISIAAEAK